MTLVKLIVAFTILAYLTTPGADTESSGKGAAGLSAAHHL
jgi:hypothetical protein